MIKIRRGVFETNSSSSHSIILTKGEPQYSNEDGYHCGWLSDNNVLHVHYNSFGRSPFNVMDTWSDKAIYLIASWSYDKDVDQKVAELEDLIREEIPEFAGFKFETRYKWDSQAKDFTDERVPDYGDIDHQSDDLMSYVLKDVPIKEFLFNDRYKVIIDGDEYCVFDNLIKQGLVDPNVIEKRWG